MFVDTFSSPIDSIGDVFVSGCHVSTRVSELLYRSKQGELSRQEESDLDRYMLLEHIVRLAKAWAYRQLAARS